MSFDRLIRKIVETKNPTVVGLDPKLEYIPEELKAEAYAKYGKTLEGAAEAILSFNKGIIDAICDVVPAVKPFSIPSERSGSRENSSLCCRRSTPRTAASSRRGSGVCPDSSSAR